MEGLYGYLCFYRGRKIEVYAETLYRAQLKAAALLKVPAKRSHEVHVVLAERPDGSEVIYTPDF